MNIYKQLYDEILKHFCTVPPEQGGIIGMKDGIICSYVHDDEFLNNERAVYIPNTIFFNKCIKKWENIGIEFCGMVHSHPIGQNKLSNSDCEYIEKIFNMNPKIDKLFFPLVIEGEGMIPYVIRQDNLNLRIKKDDVKLL